jgi:hypothetical protein
MDVYGAIGAAEPVAVVSGIQQLSPSTADDVLTLLNKRILVPDSVPAVAKGVFNFVAVTMERLAELGYKTSGDAERERLHQRCPGQLRAREPQRHLNIKLGGASHHRRRGRAVMAGPGSRWRCSPPSPRRDGRWRKPARRRSSPSSAGREPASAARGRARQRGGPGRVGSGQASGRGVTPLTAPTGDRRARTPEVV